MCAGNNGTATFMIFWGMKTTTDSMKKEHCDCGSFIFVGLFERQLFAPAAFFSVWPVPRLE
jgi:hypothetical protein